MLLSLWICAAAAAPGCTRGPDLLQRRAEVATTTLVSQQGCSAECVVPASSTWILDTSLQVETLTIWGTLEWDRSQDDLELRASYILVPDGGRFILGTADAPMDLRATVYITRSSHSHQELGRRFLGGLGSGQIEIHGRRLQKTWTLLSTTVMPGETQLELKDDAREMGWRVGDRIGLATSSRGESTVHRIRGIQGRQIQLEESVRYEHWGGYREIEGRRFELAAEVVNLERSVLITSDHQDIESTGEGLHTIQANGPGFMDMRYARVEYCGQRPVMGRYCLHFHLMKKCPRCVFQGNAVVDGEHVGITVHGTHDSLVDQNIIWDAKANGLYIEDGNELRNTLSRNVMICTHLLKCSVAWVSGASSQTAGIFMIGMTNNIVENRIIGYENGIWTLGSFRGKGHGNALNKVCPQFYPFLEWRGNTCHDCNRFGLYLDHQYPRNVKVDEDGFLTDWDSCEWFRSDGSDNGVVNEVRDEVNWHNTYVGQYAIGDIQFINYTSVNNAHAMYWKQGKDFADGRPWHILDSTFANDPNDRWGILQFLGPSGPFAFGMKNCAFLGGGPAGIAALAAGQHCGLTGGAGPCNVQYILENVDFSRMRVQQPRLAFGANGANQAEVLPMFLSKDNSLGGFRSIISGWLNGFEAAGCVPLDASWARSGLGCASPLRRLNLWGTNAGDLTLSGPGYGVPLNFAVEGRNGGRIPFDAARMAYGAVVLMDGSYELQGSWPAEALIVEFSDPVLGAYFDDGAMQLRVGGQTCELRESDDRKFICEMGEFGGECQFQTYPTHHVITAGILRCAEAGPLPPSPPVTPSPTPAPTPSPGTRPPPTSFPPIEGGLADWVLHEGLNCWDGNGAASLDGANPLPGTFTIDGCREKCEKSPECEAAVLRHGWDDGSSPCFLRKDMRLSECRDYADFDLWEIRRPVTTATTTRASTTSTSTTSLTTTVSTAPGQDFMPVDGGVDRACRGASAGDNQASYYVIQNGIADLEGCKAICVIDALCQGIEYSLGRCELWVRPEGIGATAQVEGFTCLRYAGAPTTTSTTLAGDFAPVDGGVNRVCRGSSPADNNPSHFRAMPSASLDQCKADCIAAEDCQGIEYSLGRCELWIRPEGIGATAEAQGFTCLRYMGAATTTTPRPASFSPVDGGQNRVCRGDSPSDNNPSYFTVASQDSFSLTQCRAACVAAPGCRGIEHHQGGRCELWMRDIGASRELAGYVCERLESTWRLYQGLNCHENHGATLVHQVLSNIPLEQCKEECGKFQQCEGVVVRSGWEEGPCWIYTKVTLSQCFEIADYDFWARP